jgi:hypothetical protein
MSAGYPDDRGSICHQNSGNFVQDYTFYNSEDYNVDLHLRVKLESPSCNTKETWSDRLYYSLYMTQCDCNNK